MCEKVSSSVCVSTETHWPFSVHLPQCFIVLCRPTCSYVIGQAWYKKDMKHIWSAQIGLQHQRKIYNHSLSSLAFSINPLPCSPWIHVGLLVSSPEFSCSKDQTAGFTRDDRVLCLLEACSYYVIFPTLFQEEDKCFGMQRNNNVFLRITNNADKEWVINYMGYKNIRVWKSFSIFVTERE